MSQRSCERIFGVSNKTVAKLFEEAGDMAIAHVASVGELTPTRVQADELHAFVAAKDRTLARIGSSNDAAGTVWAYLAMCADTKLIFSYRLGDRDIPDATAFARDILSKLKRDDQGELAVRPLITTDGLRAYYEAFDAVFGDEADLGTMIKRYSTTNDTGRRSRRHYVGADRVVRAGTADLRDVHTSYIERQNCNLRMGNRRYTRRTNAFSKTVLNHERHLALWIMYHNLCWVPRPKRPPPGSSRWVKRLPAGIAAGVTDKLWDIEDLLALTDQFTALTCPNPAQLKPEPASGQLPSFGQATHWVFRHKLQRTAKVHLSACTCCRDGRGKTSGAKVTGEWFPFHSFDDALAGAKALEPDRTSECRMCIGERSRLGYRHAGSSRQTPQ